MTLPSISLFSTPVRPTVTRFVYGGTSNNVPLLNFSSGLLPTASSLDALSNISVSSFIPFIPIPHIAIPSFTSITSGIKSAARKVYRTISSAVSSIGNKIVNIAKSYIGYNEKDGSYLRFTNGRREAWCADFVSYVCRQAEISGPNTASVEGIRQWGRRNGRYSSTAKVGSAVIFKNGTSHTGIVESVSNGKITCIEGNTSDKVARRTYSINDPRISGFVQLA